jgi:hypothetical protein
MDFWMRTLLAPLTKDTETRALLAHLAEIDLGGTSGSVEDHGFVALAHAQNLRSMARLGFG